MALFGKSKAVKNESSNSLLLKDYLKERGYRQISTAMTYYDLAMANLTGYCFKANEALILVVIKTIADYDGGMRFSDQFGFAERLFNELEVDIDSDNEVNNFLDNLRVCLANPVIINEFKKIKPLYILFENKRIVQGIMAELNADNLDLIIDYVTKARQYYVDERALASAVLSLCENLDDANAIARKLEEDRENAGIYNIDYYLLDEYGKKIKKLKKETKKLVRDVDMVKEETDDYVSELGGRISSIKKENDDFVSEFVSKLSSAKLETLEEISGLLKQFQDEKIALEKGKYEEEKDNEFTTSELIERLYRAKDDLVDNDYSLDNVLPAKSFKNRDGKCVIGYCNDYFFDDTSFSGSKTCYYEVFLDDYFVLKDRNISYDRKEGIPVFDIDFWRELNEIIKSLPPHRFPEDMRYLIGYFLESVAKKGVMDDVSLEQIQGAEKNDDGSMKNSLASRYSLSLKKEDGKCIIGYSYILSFSPFDDVYVGYDYEFYAVVLDRDSIYCKRVYDTYFIESSMRKKEYMCNGVPIFAKVYWDMIIDRISSDFPNGFPDNIEDIIMDYLDEFIDKKEKGENAKTKIRTKTRTVLG